MRECASIHEDEHRDEDGVEDEDEEHVPSGEKY